MANTHLHFRTPAHEALHAALRSVDFPIPTHVEYVRYSGHGPNAPPEYAGDNIYLDRPDVDCSAFVRMGRPRLTGMAAFEVQTFYGLFDEDPRTHTADSAEEAARVAADHMWYCLRRPPEP